MNRWSLSLLLCVLPACGSEFEPSSRVTKLRLLAVTADKPYARAGESVTIDALAYDPRGRTLAWGWATCTNPSAATVLGCLAQLDSGSFVIGTSSHTVTAPTGSLLGVVTVVCPGTLTAAAGAVPFRCTTPEGRALAIHEFEVGMKRILLRTTDRNGNPQIDRVLFDGADWPRDRIPEVSPCAKEEVDDCPDAHRIELRVSGAESGVDELGTPFDEQLILQYYATEGTFKAEVRTAATPENRWIARPSAAGKTLDVFLVARDDRGGATWVVRQIRVR